MTDEKRMPVPRTEYALRKAESILSLLRHRGIVDSPANRVDVDEALQWVQYALGMRDAVPLPRVEPDDPWPDDDGGGCRRCLSPLRRLLARVAGKG